VGELVNQGYESGLISILLNAGLDIIIEVRSQLSIKEFYDPKNNISACMYGIIGDLVSENRELNNANISAELIKYDNILKHIGGIGEIPSTLQFYKNYDVNVDEFQYYVDGIKKYSAGREICRQSDAIVKKVNDPEQMRKMSYDDVINLPEQMFLDVSNSRRINGENVAEGIDDFADIAEEDIGKLVGIASKHTSINKILLGYENGLMYLYSGLTGTGKSMFLLNEANHIGIDLQIPTLYIDTEMTKKQVQTRLLSMRSGLTQREIKTGKFKRDPFKVKLFEKAAAEIKTGKLIRVGVDDFDADYLMRTVRYFIHKENIQCVVFDYIKIPQITSNGLNQTQMLGNLSDSLKNKIAKKLNVPLITACQAKDEFTEADSKYMRKLADVVGFWNKKSKEDQADEGLQCGDYYLQFHKYRDNDSAELPKINFQFNGKSSAILEADNSHLADFEF
jgi:replicative DNA helicase